MSGAASDDAASPLDGVSRMAFDIGAGFSEMGKSVAQTAQAYTLEAQKADLETEKVKLADQLAGAREEKGRQFTTSEREATQTFTGGENEKTRGNQKDIATIGATAHLGAAGIAAGAARYSAELQYKAHTEALTPAEVRTAQWFSKASPEEKSAFQSALLAKAGMPDWATGSPSGTGGSATPATPAKMPGNVTGAPAGETGSVPDETPPAKPLGPKADATPAGTTGNFNDDVLKDKPPAVISTVKAMVEGRMPAPSSFAMAKPYWQAHMALAQQYDPTFDATTWASRNATRKDFTSGQSAKAVTAMNTALGHAGLLVDNFDKLDNGQIPSWNAFANAVGTAFGSDKVTNATMAVDALASEARKVFAASGGGNLTELQEWQKNFPINGSPDQQKGAMKQFVNLLDSRLMSLSDQYNRGMGRTAEPLTLLEPKARSVFEKLTGGQPESSTGYQTGKNGAPQPQASGGPAPAPAQGLPPPDRRAIGGIYDTPTGKYIWMGNGWAPAPTSLKMPGFAPQDER